MISAIDQRKKERRSAMELKTLFREVYDVEVIAPENMSENLMEKFGLWTARATLVVIDNDLKNGESHSVNPEAIAEALKRARQGRTILIISYHLEPHWTEIADNPAMICLKGMPNVGFIYFGQKKRRPNRQRRGKNMVKPIDQATAFQEEYWRIVDGNKMADPLAVALFDWLENPSATRGRFPDCAIHSNALVHQNGTVNATVIDWLDQIEANGKPVAVLTEESAIEVVTRQLRRYHSGIKVIRLTLLRGAAIDTVIVRNITKKEMLDRYGISIEHLIVV